MLSDMLEFRRAVRHFDSTKPIDTNTVEKCLKLATLAPSSSNMQLYEFYHITNPNILKKLATACFNQRAATTANQMVVFVTRTDLYKSRAKTMLALEEKNVLQNSPKDRQHHRIKRWQLYYGRVMPVLYSRCFGLWGGVRKLISAILGCFRPTAYQVSENDMRVVAHKSCALAAQVFMLAMAENTYDTCPLEGFDSHRVKKILGLKRGAEINMIVCCGIRKPGHGIWGERTRIPFSTIYYRN